jgi:hypothetical protein
MVEQRSPFSGTLAASLAGKEELISRRIGRNELRTIALCEGFVSAQREYAQDSPSAGAYARKFLSSEGKRDGLYWPAKTGEPQSPLGPLAAEAARDGYEAKASASGPKPFHGYFFKILTSQGENAPGGAKNYVADGKMTGGRPHLETLETLSSLAQATTASAVEWADSAGPS